jgi:hypothetical protein
LFSHCNGRTLLKTSLPSWSNDVIWSISHFIVKNHKFLEETQQNSIRISFNLVSSG